MAHPTPPSSGENLFPDDDDVILLTDEIPSAKIQKAIEGYQLADRDEPSEVHESSETAAEKPASTGLTDAIDVSGLKASLPPDFTVSEADLLNFDMKAPQPSDAFRQTPETSSFTANDIQIADTEYPPDDLQRLIDEVVHDSQVPPQDFSGSPRKGSDFGDSPVVQDDWSCLSQNQIDAALERVIRNLFAEKIKVVLDEVITTTVNREIETLKSILLDYLISGKSSHDITS